MKHLLVVITGNNSVRVCGLSSDLVYIQRRSCLCRSLSASPDTSCRCNGVSCSWWSVVLWKVKTLKGYIVNEFCSSRFLVLTQSLLYSVLGAVFIMLGLYLVLWGKNEERRQKVEETSQQDPESLTKHLLEEHWFWIVYTSLYIHTQELGQDSCSSSGSFFLLGSKWVFTLFIQWINILVVLLFEL